MMPRWGRDNFGDYDYIHFSTLWDSGMPLYFDIELCNKNGHEPRERRGF